MHADLAVAAALIGLALSWHFAGGHFIASAPKSGRTIVLIGWILIVVVAAILLYVAAR